MRVGDEWRDVVDPWTAESRHRGLARPHLEALARATFAKCSGLYWWQASALWVAALYEDEPT